MRGLNVLLAIVVSLVIGLAVLEVGLRVIGLGPVDTGVEFDPTLGWHKRPNNTFERSTREFDVELVINELGLRDDPLSNPKKPANTFRVLVLGDSFTLGFSVAREDLFVDILERWWRDENRRVDVINAGTQGYSTDQEVAWFEQYGGTFEPDLVLLVAYENDLYWNGVGDYMGKPKPTYRPDGSLASGTLADTTEDSWKDHSAITKLLKKRKAFPEHFFVPQAGKRTILKEQGALLLDAPDFMAPAVANTRGALLAWKRACDAHGARAVLLPIPSRSAVDPDHRKGFDRVLGVSPDRWSPDKPVDTFLGLARELGIDALDPRTFLKASGGGKLYYDIDWHVNAAGNRELARFLHDELDHMGAFPEGHRPAPGTAVAMPVVAARAGVPFGLKLFGVLWAALTLLYLATYKDEPRWQPPLKVAALLAAVFGIVIGGNFLVALLPPRIAALVLVLFVVGILTFVAYKLGRRLATIFELMRSFVLRGHWYLMPLVIVLLTIGSLLVVAASSPLVAPFIYTLF